MKLCVLICFPSTYDLESMRLISSVSHDQFSLPYLHTFPILGQENVAFHGKSYLKILVERVLTK